jgi:hypothetical protein
MQVFAARVGLTARGVVYIFMGALAFLIARGAHAEVDQKSVLAQVLRKPDGTWLVALLAFGFGCYALWRFYEAFAPNVASRTTGSRVLLFMRGVIYAGLAYSAFAVLNGSTERQSTQQRDYAITIMSHRDGRWLIGLIGFIILAVGIAQVREGIKLTFMRYFQGQNLSHEVRKWIRHLGRIGTIARGFVFAITGLLVISAAWTENATRATGLDGAVKALRNHRFGALLLGVVATGMIIFGVYGLAEARYRHI